LGILEEIENRVVYSVIHGKNDFAEISKNLVRYRSENLAV